MEDRRPISRRLMLQALTLGAGGLILPPGLVMAGRTGRITAVRLWTAPDHTRIVFDLDQMVEHRLFRLHNPERVVVDISGVEMRASLNGLGLPDPVVRRIRSGNTRPDVVRAVIETQMEVQPRSFLLKAAAGKGPRLVLDLVRRDGAGKAEEAAPRGEAERQRRRGGGVIVLDPGHGGEDPGAIGAKGSYEKNITLEVARKLARRINATPGFKAHLTRTGDYYVPLRGRVAIARRYEPDLFISLHADAVGTRSVKGASVYCLSERGKPSPDRAINDLVNRENNADLIGGVDLEEVADREVAGILMDLAQRDSLNRALMLGEKLLSSLKRITPLKYDEVKQAGFAVLKAPDMPSVLVEMAYLSNPDEERLLNHDGHQGKLAEAILTATRGFLDSSRRA